MAKPTATIRPSPPSSKGWPVSRSRSWASQGKGSREGTPDMRIANNVLEVIGNTPLVRLNRVVGHGAAEVCVKLEYLNPSGSTKDRIALQMVRSAERDGRLRPGGTIIEASTGNTAAALACVAAVKGYKMVVFTPEAVASPERLKISRSFGAEVRPINTKAVEVQLVQEGEAAHGGIWEIIPRMLCN